MNKCMQGWQGPVKWAAQRTGGRFERRVTPSVWSFHASASPPSASCPVQCYLQIGVLAHTRSTVHQQTPTRVSHTLSARWFISKSCFLGWGRVTITMPRHMGSHKTLRHKDRNDCLNDPFRIVFSQLCSKSNIWLLCMWFKPVPVKGWVEKTHQCKACKGCPNHHLILEDLYTPGPLSDSSPKLKSVEKKCQPLGEGASGRLPQSWLQDVCRARKHLYMAALSSVITHTCKHTGWKMSFDPTTNKKKKKNNKHTHTHLSACLICSRVKGSCRYLSSCVC